MRLSYHCQICNNDFTVFYEEEKSKKIPTMTKNLHFQNHHSHTVFFTIDNHSINSIKSVNIIRNVVDTLVYNNAAVSRVVNTLVKSEKLNYKPYILFITDVKGYKNYFKTLMKEYITSHDTIHVNFNEKYLTIDHSSIRLVISSIESSKQFFIGEKKCENELFGKQNLRLKSIIIDTTFIDTQMIIDILLTKKVNINKNTKVILAFNDKRVKEPPFVIQEVLYDKHKIIEIDILNYFDTNGLNSIILQSYFNLHSNPISARDTFEQISNHSNYLSQ